MKPVGLNLSAPFIARPIATTLLTLAILLSGLAAFTQLPVSPLPQVDFPTIVVNASLPGASPETIAATIATPLERTLGRIAGVSEITSSSSLGNTRVTYNFTPSVFVQTLLQYNDRTDRWSTNLRFHWLETAGTGLFLVYNNTEALNGLGPVNRAFIVKYVRQFDILN